MDYFCYYQWIVLFCCIAVIAKAAGCNNHPSYPQKDCYYHQTAAWNHFDYSKNSLKHPVKCSVIK